MPTLSNSSTGAVGHTFGHATHPHSMQPLHNGTLPHEYFFSLYENFLLFPFYFYFHLQMRWPFCRCFLVTLSDKINRETEFSLCSGYQVTRLKSNIRLTSKSLSWTLVREGGGWWQICCDATRPHSSFHHTITVHYWGNVFDQIQVWSLPCLDGQSLRHWCYWDLTDVILVKMPELLLSISWRGGQQLWQL